MVKVKMPSPGIAAAANAETAATLLGLWLGGERYRNTYRPRSPFSRPDSRVFMWSARIAWACVGQDNKGGIKVKVNIAFAVTYVYEAADPRGSRVLHAQGHQEGDRGQVNVKLVKPPLPRGDASATAAKRRGQDQVRAVCQSFQGAADQTCAVEAYLNMLMYM